ncbi:hypothetical protein [Parendozoicomonas haliclonae]|uniref:Uncharacterized protein n=1 Tax=Parendozoicomonas haliclonae TaxID=1960125 RepID=A0A1X7AN81_9GAMM|nr:hypothetical protein [Parendozoicomonas haliclonae]SMA49735.1 hypothetical protein EHSB41UT_03517 [Parendozoicomonas haliclonae]
MEALRNPERWHGEGKGSDESTAQSARAAENQTYRRVNVQETAGLRLPSESGIRLAQELAGADIAPKPKELSKFKIASIFYSHCLMSVGRLKRNWLRPAFAAPFIFYLARACYRGMANHLIGAGLPASIAGGVSGVCLGVICVSLCAPKIWGVIEGAQDKVDKYKNSQRQIEESLAAEREQQIESGDRH